MTPRNFPKPEPSEKKPMKIARVVLALALVPAAFVLSTAADLGDARACGMSIRMDPTPQRPTPVQEIARAEKSLESGQNLAAAQAILGTFPRIRTTTAGANPLETRALRVFSLAIVRSEGSVDEKKAHVASANGVDWTPKANLEWAVQALREIDEKRPNDPTVQADLGEALSKTAAGQAESLEILQGLARKDLMGSPHAYAALAKLRTHSGDSAGAEAAIKRCEEMSKTPGICKPSAPGNPSAPSSKPSVAAKV
jgi:Flp pilus assembly protein TadD